MSFSALSNHAEDVQESAAQVWACASERDLAGAREGVARARRYVEKMESDLAEIEANEGGA